MTSIPAPLDRLRSLLSEHKPAPNAIARLFDDLPAAERLALVRSLRRAELQGLFDAVDGFAPMTLEQLVPAERPLLTPVRHYGRNSLPMFRQFEKRFYRLPEPEAVGGANFQTTSWFTGPGYFVARPAAQGGELVLDYTTLPPAAPSGWPALCGNDNGTARLVYGGMVDRLRRVSEHVCIGSAAKRADPAGRVAAYFALCREAD